jgi:quercetin dioxygenase-like cupin family protein
MILSAAMEHRALGWEQIADCGAMRVVGLRLAAGQRVPEHRNALPLAVIVTEGVLRYSEGKASGEANAGEARAGELILINPGERHTYWAEEATAAYMVFAGLPGARARTWSLRRR